MIPEYWHFTWRGIYRFFSITLVWFSCFLVLWTWYILNTYWMENAILQLQIVRSSLHIVTYPDVGNFCDKSIETALHEIYVQVFLRFSDSSKPSLSILMIYELAWLLESVNLRKTCSKLHVKLLLWPNCPHILKTSWQSASAGEYWCDISWGIPY